MSEEALESAPRPGRAWLLPALLVGLGLITQARARAPGLWAGDTDAPKYLALARGLPGYLLYDEHPFLIHPPGYPCAIRALAGLTGLELTRAGALLGGLCVIGLALVTYALGRRLLGLSPPLAALAGALLLISRAAEVLGQGVWREPFQTLAVYGLLLLALPPTPPQGRGRRRLLLLACAALGCLLGATWDPFVLSVPLLLGGAWLLRRPPLLAAAVALLLTWGSWAQWRHELLAAGTTYPAGIDGTVEETADLPLETWLNPNFLPRTAHHNAYFWPVTPTPLRPLRAAAPWFLAPPDYALTAHDPGWPLQAGALLLGALALGGLVLLVRAPPPAWRALLLVALVGGLLGGPGLIGRTARYGFALVPLVALLVAWALERGTARWPALQPRLTGAVAGLVALTALGWLLGSQAWTWTRRQYYEARSAAAAIAALDSDTRPVAATINVTPDLAWALPGRRVVTLPALPSWGLDALLADRDVGPVVVPHEVHPWDRPGTAPAWRDEAHSLPTLAALAQRARQGQLTYLGVTLEAEQGSQPRVRTFDLLWRGPGAPAPFGLWLQPASLPALARALEADAVSPETRRLLRTHRAALQALSAREPTAARAVLQALGP